jgi:hypothetical protein
MRYWSVKDVTLRKLLSESFNKQLTIDRASKFAATHRLVNDVRLAWQLKDITKRYKPCSSRACDSWA